MSLLRSFPVIGAIAIAALVADVGIMTTNNDKQWLKYLS